MTTPIAPAGPEKKDRASSAIPILAVLGALCLAISVFFIVSWRPTVINVDHTREDCTTVRVETPVPQPSGTPSMQTQSVTTTCTTTNPLTSWPGMLGVVGIASLLPLLTSLVVAPGMTYKIGPFEIGRSHDPTAQTEKTAETAERDALASLIISELHHTIAEAGEVRLANAVDDAVQKVKTELEPLIRRRRFFGGG